MVKRILKIVREEYHNSLKSNTPETFDENQSLAKMFTTAESDNEAFGAAIDQGKVKDSILYSISELLDELETCGESIANQALEHIYSEDVIMTIGRSRTVEAFLKHAARSKRTFQVIVAECAPFYKVRHSWLSNYHRNGQLSHRAGSLLHRWPRKASTPFSFPTRPSFRSCPG